MLLVDGAGLPLAIDIDSASPAEVTLIEPLLEEAVAPFVPDRLIYDRAATAIRFASDWPLATLS
jgi:hypothetical protein